MNQFSRFALIPTVCMLLLPGVSNSQTQLDVASLKAVVAEAGESKVVAWPVPNSRLASVTSLTASPRITFPPQAELVDANDSPHLKLILPPATPPGEYRVDLSGRSLDGRPIAATMSLTVNPVTLPKPSNGRNPVILLNGFQVLCPIWNSDSTLAASVDTFGQMASLLQADGAPVAFFNNCSYGDIRIEDLAVQLSRYIAGLTYTDGSAVTQVDIVAHSMGGLIARAYLAGLQSDGSLLPPPDPKVGRLVLISTPNFGSFQATRLGVQAPQMIPGSSFLWNLARWNQGQDDLRGVDALAVIGASGYYYAAGNLDDGVVSLTSGSLRFSRPDQRTRVVPYCHVTPGLATLGGTVFMSCSGAHGIADIDSPAHQTAQIVRSFLAGTTAWTALGQPPSQQPSWSLYGGIYFAVENTAGTQYLNDLTNVLWGSIALHGGGAAGEIFYNEFINGTGTFQFTSSSLGTVGCGSFTAPAGYYFPVRCKYGPNISSVTPLISNLSGKFVQSGSKITLQGTSFGQQCSTCQVLASPGKVPLAISAWSDQSITVSLPASLTGLVHIAVQAAGGGSDAVDIMVAASPTILLSNSKLQFSFTVGDSLPPSQFVAVSNAEGGTLSWSAAPNATWITTSATPSTLTVQVSPNGLAAGVHQGSISITTSGAANSPQNVSVTLTVAASAQGPVIRSVQNAFGGSSIIAPNTWAIVLGSTLAPGSRTWTGSDFVGNRMPVALDGVSVTMNGQPVYLYYISPTQFNILTPPDLGLGPVQVQVINNGAVSAAFTVQVQQYAPSFFVVDASHVTGTHGDGSLLGPTSLYPGYSTPAKPNETVILYANGFGPTSSPVVSGDVTQSGSLPVLPLVSIGGISATVQFAGLVSPGLYQFNIVVPGAAQNGENALTATYKGLTTQAGVHLTVQSLPAQVTLHSLTLTPTSITGGQSSTGTVTLSGSAPTGGVDVQVSLGTQAPVAIRVAAGQTSATFTITTAVVTSATTLTITAALNGIQRTATLTVLPGVSTNPFRDNWITMTGTMTLAGKTIVTTIISSAPGSSPEAVVDTTADMSSGIVVYCYFFNPTLSGNTVTFTGTNGQGIYTNASGSGTGVITSGTLSLTATSPNVGTSVSGTLQFSTAGGSFSATFTGKIVSSVQ